MADTGTCMHDSRQYLATLKSKKADQEGKGEKGTQLVGTRMLTVRFKRADEKIDRHI